MLYPLLPTDAGCLYDVWVPGMLPKLEDQQVTYKWINEQHRKADKNLPYRIAVLSSKPVGDIPLLVKGYTPYIPLPKYTSCQEMSAHLQCLGSSRMRETCSQGRIGANAVGNVGLITFQAHPKKRRHAILGEHQ